MSAVSWATTVRENPEQVWLKFRQLCLGVACCHEHNVVHRDIKPSNIFISADGTVKLGDFGLAVKIVSTTSEHPGGMSIPHTGSEGDLFAMSPHERTGLAGTPLYVCPECTDLTEVAPAHDLYSLGVVLYEMFAVFSTQMERCRALEALRVQPPTLPEVFMKLHPIASRCILLLTVPRSNRLPVREIIKEIPIAESSLLDDEQWHVKELEQQVAVLNEDVRVLRGEVELKTTMIVDQDQVIEATIEKHQELYQEVLRRDKRIQMLEIKVAQLEAKSNY